MRAPACQRQEEFGKEDILATIFSFVAVLAILFMLNMAYLNLNGHREVVTGTDYNSVTTSESGKMTVSNPELFEVGAKVLVGTGFVSNYSFGIFTGSNTSRYTIVHSTSAM